MIDEHDVAGGSATRAVAPGTVDPVGLPRCPIDARRHLLAGWRGRVDHRLVAAHVGSHDPQEEGTSHRLDIAAAHTD